MKVDFKAAYRRWEIPAYDSGTKRPPDELHVTPKNSGIRD